MSRVHRKYGKRSPRTLAQVKREEEKFMTQRDVRLGKIVDPLPPNPHVCARCGAVLQPLSNGIVHECIVRNEREVKS